jgi:glutaredoxin-related protein
VTESSEAYELCNVVETALARALVLAAEAKRWDVVIVPSLELMDRFLDLRDQRALLRERHSVQVEELENVGILDLLLGRQRAAKGFGFVETPCLGIAHGQEPNVV